jgi:hypothetical protein
MNDVNVPSKSNSKRNKKKIIFRWRLEGHTVCRKKQDPGPDPLLVVTGTDRGSRSVPKAHGSGKLQKTDAKLSEIWSGMFTPDPDLGSRVKIAPDPGSGTKVVRTSLMGRYLYWKVSDSYPVQHSCISEKYFVKNGAADPAPVPSWPLDPGSGIGKKSEPDPGSGSGMNNPDNISESLKKQFFGAKIFKVFDVDPGWKKFGSGINIPGPQHWDWPAA